MSKAKPSTGTKQNELRQTSVPSTDLLIGTSILRDIASTDKNLQISSNSGATVEELTTKLKDYPNDKFASVTLHVGSIDCERINLQLDKIVDNYKVLISEAKRTSFSMVRVSSILPGNMGDALNTRIKQCNTKLKDLCLANDCEFIDNDLNFCLQNGKADDSMLLPDKKHLSQRGSIRLLDNFGVSKRCRYRDHRNLSKYRSTYYQSNMNRNASFPYPQQQYKITPTNSATLTAPLSNVNTPAVPIQSMPLQGNSQYVFKPRTLAPNNFTDGFAGQNSSSNGPSYSVPFNNNQNQVQAFHAIQPTSQQSYQPSSRSDPQQWASQSYQPRCWLCGEQGHTSGSCTNSNYISCFICGGTGHKSRMCPVASLKVSKRMAKNWGPIQFQ